MGAFKIALAALATSVLASAAHAGAWPEVGDQFRLDDGTLLVVARIKMRPGVNESLVCLHKSGGAQDRSCTWAKVGDLHGDWITYGGIPQCFKYDTPVTLTGTISVQRSVEPLERYFLLKLDTSLCTSKSDKDEESKSGLSAIHLLYSPPGGPSLTNDEQIKMRPPWIGPHVLVRGTLFHANTYHHQTPVVIDASEIHLSKPVAGGTTAPAQADARIPAAFVDDWCYFDGKVPGVENASVYSRCKEPDRGASGGGCEDITLRPDGYGSCASGKMELECRVTRVTQNSVRSRCEVSMPGRRNRSSSLVESRSRRINS